MHTSFYSATYHPSWIWHIIGGIRPNNYAGTAVVAETIIEALLWRSELAILRELVAGS